MIKFYYIIPVVFALLFFACSPAEKMVPPTNPFDPDNPDFELPYASVIGEVDIGEVIDTSAVTIIWRGNETAYEYSYRYDLEIVETEWSAWTRDTSVILRYLDEGNYQFDLKARTNQTVPVEGDANSFHFSVDAVKGPAIMVFPRYKEVSVGEEFEIEILAEEVDSLMGTEIHVAFNPLVIRVKSVAYSPFLYEDLANGVSFKEIDNENGTIEMVVVRSSGSEPTVSGTGAVAILEIEALTVGTTEIAFTDMCTFRNKDNLPIAIREKTIGIVLVE